MDSEEEGDVGLQISQSLLVETIEQQSPPVPLPTVHTPQSTIVIEEEDEKEVVMSLSVSQPLTDQATEQPEQLSPPPPSPAPVTPQSTTCAEEEEVAVSLSVSQPLTDQAAEQPEQILPPPPLLSAPVASQSTTDVDEGKVTVSLPVSQPLMDHAAGQPEQSPPPLTAAIPVLEPPSPPIPLTVQVSQPVEVKTVEQQSLPPPLSPAPPPPPRLTPPPSSAQHPLVQPTHPGPLTTQRTNTEGKKKEIAASLEVSGPLVVKNIERPKQLPEPIASPKAVPQGRVSKDNNSNITADLRKEQNNPGPKDINIVKRIDKDNGEEVTGN